MKYGIEVKIDVKKILKERLYKGDKATYLTMTTFIDTEQKDQYGNHGFIAQSVDKEERAQGVTTPILGNCKIFYTENSQQSYDQSQARKQPKQESNDFDQDDLDQIPF